MEPYLDSDWSERGALIGVLEQAGSQQVVALASYARLRDRRAAEVAFAVADAQQRAGIATRMLEQLARRASAEGIERFVFEILPANAAMLRVVQGAGFDVSRETTRGVVEVTMSIEATPAFEARVHERDHVAVSASLAHFLDPASVAVYGASARRGTIGGELFRNILDGGYARPAYPVNRGGDAVAGVPGLRTLAGIEPAVELALICMPAEAVLDAASDALSAGVRSLCVVSAGFAEVGSEGAARQDRLLALVRSYGGRLVGPNCLGIASTAAGLNATFAAQPPPPGGVGFASQSGALGLAVVEQARGRGLGLSSFVSLGNKADVSSNDLLEYWEDDDATSVVALYLESFGNPLRFGRIARRVARSKPVLALKGGATAAGARAAASHTAALAGSDVAVDALFRQAGVQRTRTLSEFLDAAALLSSQPPLRGRHVAVLTNAGGLAILCADACAAEGARAAVAIAGDARRPAGDRAGGGEPREPDRRARIGHRGDVRRACCRCCSQIPPSTPSACSSCARSSRAPRTSSTAVDRAIAEAGHDKPVVGVFLSAEEEHAATPRASRGSTRPRRRRARSASRPAVPSGCAGLQARSRSYRTSIAAAHARSPSRRSTDVDDVWLDALQSRALLEAYGIRLAPEALAETPEQAAHAAHVIGMPVVVKSAAAGMHKTESGGVALDLRDREAVLAAAKRIGCPVLVQPMLGGAELLVGATQDPTFGPLVADRSRRRAGRADRRRLVRARAAHGQRRCRAARTRPARTARRGLPRSPAARRRRARRSAPPPLGPGARSARARRARSQSDPRRRSRVLRDRPPGAPAAPRGRAAHQDLVAAPRLLRSGAP